MMNEARYSTKGLCGTPDHMIYGAFGAHSDNLKARYGGKIAADVLKKRLYSDLIKPYYNTTQPNVEQGTGVQISFQEFMQTRPDGGPILLNERGAPLTWADLFEMAKIDPASTLLNQIATIPDDFRLLLGLYITDAFIKGFSQTNDGQSPLWSKLCFQTGVATPFPEIRRTWYKFEGEPKPTAEAETFPEAKISVGTEAINSEKRGINLKLTEELVRSSPLNVVEGWLVETGRVYQHIEDSRAVTTLVNGDLQSGANAAPVVGISDVNVGIDYADFSRCWNRGSMIGERWFSVIAGEDMSNKIAGIDEFKERQVGTPQVQLVNRPEPSQIDRFVSAQVPDNQIVLLDKTHCLRQRNFIPLRIDKSFKPENWIHGITIGYQSAFERVADKAVVILNETLSYNDYPFPTWFTVGGVRP